jgi:hypothetical protein
MGSEQAQRLPRRVARPVSKGDSPVSSSPRHGPAVARPLRAAHAAQGGAAVRAERGRAEALRMRSPGLVTAAGRGRTVRRFNWRAVAALLALAALWWLFTAASRCDGGRPRPTELIPAEQPDGRK